MLGLKTGAAAPLLFSKTGLFVSVCTAPGGKAWPGRKPEEGKEKLTFNTGSCGLLNTYQKTALSGVISEYTEYSPFCKCSVDSPSSWGRCFCLPPQEDTTVSKISWSDVGQPRGQAKSKVGFLWFHSLRRLVLKCQAAVEDTQDNFSLILVKNNMNMG